MVQSVFSGKKFNLVKVYDANAEQKNLTVCLWTICKLNLAPTQSIIFKSYGLPSFNKIISFNLS